MVKDSSKQLPVSISEKALQTYLDNEKIESLKTKWKNSQSYNMIFRFLWGKNNTYRFDFLNNKWKLLLNSKFQQNFLYFSSHVVVNQKPNYNYILGGINDQKIQSNKVIRFNPKRKQKSTSKFQVCEGMIQKRGFFSSCYSSPLNQIFICGGFNSDMRDLAECQVLQNARSQDPSKLKWQQLPSMNYARSGCSCIYSQTRNSIIVAGGWNQIYGALDSIQELRLQTCNKLQWVLHSCKLTQGLKDLSIISLKGEQNAILQLGGCSSDDSNSLEVAVIRLPEVQNQENVKILKRKLNYGGHIFNAPLIDNSGKLHAWVGYGDQIPFHECVDVKELVSFQ